MEECDGLQGLQIVTGVDDAWGGWAARWMERLRDEFGKLGIWVWGVGGQGASPGVARVSGFSALRVYEFFWLYGLGRRVKG